MSIFSRNDQDGNPRRKIQRLPLLIVTLVIFASLAMAVLNFTVFNAAKNVHADSWTQVWGDDFNGNSGIAPSSDNWLYDLGTSYPGGASNWGTSEVESNTNSTNNVYQDGKGHLAIKPIRDGNGNWTSGRIETQNSTFAAPVGGQMAIEASIQLPNVTGSAAAGYWPAFWALSSSFRGVYTNWPMAGEIDAMENINGLNTEYGTLHCGVDPGGPCNETTGRGGNTPCNGTTCQGGFHTYRVEVDRSTSPEQIRWYLDGKQFWQVSSNSSGMNATTWANAVDHSFFIILNVAMGGAFPAAFGGGPTGATQSGVPMLIDYVHVFTSGGSTGGATPTPTPNTPDPTPTPNTPNPTPTPTSGCTADSSGVTSASASTVLAWYQPCSYTAGYVIMHYTVGDGSQQNVTMKYNSSTGRWEYTASGISSGQALRYSFTYQKSELQHDTNTTSWTHP